MRTLLSSHLVLGLFCFLPLSSQAQSLPRSAAAGPAHTDSLVEEDYAKEPYVFDLIQSTVRFESDGKGYRDLLIRVRIQSESAVHEFGLLAYPFAARFETLDIVYARVRKPDGSIIETPLSDVQELDSAVSREAPMYTDEREKHIAIKSLGVGDILEAHLHWTINEPIAPGHFWFDYSYFNAGICLNELLEINIPSNPAVQLRNSDPQPSIREQGDRRIYIFQRAHLKKSEESKTPDWEKDYLGVAPPDIQLSSFASWQEVGRWFGELANPKASVTPEIRAKAEELTKGKSTEDEKLHALYDFVSARYRYIGVDLGISRYTPHSATDVLANRYGDCKDKHVLFAALLQAVAIQAYPALISSKFRINSSFPSPSLFDHIITAIPRGDSFLILDTTPEIAPFGLLLANLRNRQALVVPVSSPARLVTTPVDPPFLSFEHFQMDASLDSKGTLDGKMHLEVRGDSEMVFRQAYRSTPQNRWQELTQNIVARLGFGGTISDATVSQPEDTAKPFTISCSYHRTDFSDWKNHRISLPTPPVFVASLTEEQKLSKDPLPLGAPAEVIHEATVKLPPEFSIVLPPNVSRKSGFADFSANYSFKDSLLRGKIQLNTLLHEVPGDKRLEFSNLTSAINDADGRFILVTGKFPDGPPFGQDLLGFYDDHPEGTIPALEQAVGANPDNLMMLLMLGNAYLHGGRPKDAIAVLEKVLSKSPADPFEIYLALGNAYLAVPDADKALENFKKSLGDDPRPNLLNSIAYSLAEAKLHLKEALEYSNRSLSILSEQTMDITPDSAQRSDYALMVQLAANWDTLGLIKLRMGDFPAAEKYLEASWRLLQRGEVGEHLVEAYEALGDKIKAAAVCNLAIAAAAHYPFPDKGLGQKLKDEMARLRPLLQSSSPTGSKSSVRALPDPYVALTNMRSVNIPLRAKLKGQSARATFAISFLKGPKVEEIVFLSGSEELRALVPPLSAAKYPLSFPDDTPARILLKANLNCSIYSRECLLFISTITEAASALSSEVNTSPQ